MKKKQDPVVRENFIEFLASATPEEINTMIREKGKPPKLIEPMVFFKDRKNKQSE
jgi:hypothetical protein